MGFLKHIDRWGWPLATWVGWTLRWIGWFVRHLRRSADFGEVPPLVIRPGGMGDLICADMALEGLGVDSRRLTWLIEKRSEPWAKYRQFNYLCYDRKPLLTIIRVLGKYSQVINTEQYFGLSQAFALSALGPSGRLVSFATNRARWFSDLQVPYEPRISHEVEEFEKLFHRALQPSLDVGEQIPEMTPRSRRRPASGQRVIAIAGRQSATRSLSLDQWIGISKKWLKDKSTWVIAAPIDREFQMRLVESLPHQGEAFLGSFEQCCDVIASAPEVLTIDGGMVHVASYFGVPSTVIFTSSQDRKWAPLGEGSKIVLRRDLSCRPCALYAQVPLCPHSFACRDLSYDRDLLSH